MATLALAAVVAATAAAMLVETATVAGMAAGGGELRPRRLLAR
jgi:hypothetical protein